MNQPDRETDVLAAVSLLVDSLLDDFDVVDLLTQLTEQCVKLLDVEAAGLLLADAHGQLHLMAATSGSAQALELIQLQIDEGPCLDCFAAGEPISIADLQPETERWPGFVPVALRCGFASVHALPMRAAGLVLGAMGLFGTSTGELAPADLLVAKTLAHIATVAILQEQASTPAAVLPRLRAAIISRVVVEQAKGYLHERLDISLDDAFDLMRNHARIEGPHLTTLARTLMSDDEARPALVTAMSERRA